MTTDSNLPQKLTLLFSKEASAEYKTYRVRMRDGQIHAFNMIVDVAQPPKAIEGYDDVVRVEIEARDITLSRGSNARPPLGQLVQKEKPVTPRYNTRRRRPVSPKPIMSQGFI